MACRNERQTLRLYLIIVIHHIKHPRQFSTAANGLLRGLARLQTARVS
jgi:hypothetical protein